MPLGALEEQVTVIGQSPLVDVKSTVKGMTMTKEMFSSLPRGRDFDSLVGAVPGVQNERLLSGISVDGASGAENMFYVDGTDITNPYVGVRGQGVAFEFVDEVQVKASGYQAEFGGSLGGVIQVITRQGGNAFHGDVIGYYSGSSLTGKERDTLRLGLYDINIAEYVNYQDLYGKDKVDRLEAGFNLGGYIIKDRFWFFGSLLPVYNTTTRHVCSTRRRSKGITRRGYLMELPGQIDVAAFQVPAPGRELREQFITMKGAAAPGRHGRPHGGLGRLRVPLPRLDRRAYADFIFGKNALFSLRGGSIQQLWSTGPSARRAAACSSADRRGNPFPGHPFRVHQAEGLGELPGSRGLDDSKRSMAQKTFVGNDLAFISTSPGNTPGRPGPNGSRTSEDSRDGYGYDYPRLSERQFLLGPAVIYWGQNYGRGTYGYYAASGMPASGPRGYFYKIHNDRWSLFLQDSWTIKDRLTLDLGVRAESEYLPSYSDEPV